MHILLHVANVTASKQVKITQNSEKAQRKDSEEEGTYVMHTVEPHLTDTLNSGHPQYNGQF